MDKVPVYLWPVDAASEAAMSALFGELTRGMHVESPWLLEVEGRQLVARRGVEGVVWFDFATLCRGPRGSADYIELARQFHTVFIEGVSRFSGAEDDVARRFITLVDEFYDHGVKLVLSADCPLQDLYAGEGLRFAFDRTVSRLVEMQTPGYLARAHSPE
jgi:cell division protein ZapE